MEFKYEPFFDAIINVNLDGTISSWNTGAEKMFGYCAKDAINQNISMIIPEEAFEEETDTIAKVIKGQVKHYETVGLNKEGHRIFITLMASPIKDEKGKVTGISKMLKNNHYQKLAEEKQAMLAAIVSSSNEAIISKTLDGIITSWNEAAKKMFGFTEAEALGKHISIIIPAERIEEEKLIIEKMRKGERVDHFETIRVAKDGSPVNISLTVSPVKNNKGEVIGVSKVARNISLMMEAQRQQQLYIQKLRELNEYKDEFMVMASHELKTPLTVILANLQILELKMSADPNINFIHGTVKQVKKLSDLISNLLDVSKIQAGKLELNPSSFDINLLIAEIRDELQQTTTDHKIIFKEDKKTLIADADRERMEHVIMNILGNAIKYSPNAGEIVINSRLDKDRIIVSIRDNGIGINQEDLENIFTRFYRVRGLASSFSGSGIGLYIASEIIKRHGGDIWAESEIGKGSVFNFSIPVKNKWK